MEGPFRRAPVPSACISRHRDLPALCRGPAYVGILRTGKASLLLTPLQRACAGGPTVQTLLEAQPPKWGSHPVCLVDTAMGPATQMAGEKVRPHEALGELTQDLSPQQGRAAHTVGHRAGVGVGDREGSQREDGPAHGAGA